MILHPQNGCMDIVQPFKKKENVWEMNLATWKNVPVR